MASTGRLMSVNFLNPAMIAGGTFGGVRDIPTLPSAAIVKVWRNSASGGLTPLARADQARRAAKLARSPAFGGGACGGGLLASSCCASTVIPLPLSNAYE